MRSVNLGELLLLVAGSGRAGSLVARATGFGGLGVAAALVLVATSALVVAKPLDPATRTGGEQAPGWAGGPLEVVWNHDAGRAVDLAPIVAQDRLFLATTDKRLLCYDLESGKRIWKRRYKVDLPTAPALLGEGAGARVFLQVGARQDARLHALRAADGEELWKIPAFPRAVQLATGDSTLFLLQLSGRLVRLAPEDGEVIWEREGLGWDPAGLVLTPDALYVLARADSLLALEPLTGERLWAAYLPGRFAAAPGIAQGRILAVNVEGGIFAVATADGAVLPLGTRRAQQLLPAARIGPRVLTVSSDGWVEAGSVGGVGPRAESGAQAEVGTGGAPGGLDWSTDLGEAVSAAPQVVGELLLVPTAAGRLVALRGESGAQVWSLELGERLATAPVLTERYLVVATNEGDVYAYTH